MPPKITGKLGNVGIAGIGWETSQIYFTSSDIRTGVQLLSAPELYSRSNKIVSLDISTSATNTIHFSGNGTTPDLTYLMAANTPLHVNFDDPMVFPSGISTKVIGSAAANVYITAKYFVE